jgi:hypothetical protein
VLRGTFGLKREKVAGRWKRLHNEELHNLYVSQNIRSSKSRRIREGGTCSRHVRNEKFIQFFSENLKGRDHVEDLGVDGG